MAQYVVPPDIREKEKIVGGVLTATQLFWILGGVGVTALLSFITFPILGSASIIISLFIGLPAGVCFAFIKRHGLPLFDYLKERAKHKKKTKQLINYRKEVDM